MDFKKFNNFKNFTNFTNFKNIRNFINFKNSKNFKYIKNYFENFKKYFKNFKNYLKNFKHYFKNFKNFKNLTNYFKKFKNFKNYLMNHRSNRTTSIRIIKNLQSSLNLEPWYHWPSLTYGLCLWSSNKPNLSNFIINTIFRSSTNRLKLTQNVSNFSKLIAYYVHNIYIIIIMYIIIKIYYIWNKICTSDS